MTHHKLLEALLPHECSQLLFDLESLEPAAEHLLNEDDTFLTLCEIVSINHAALEALKEGLDTDGGTILLKQAF